jgi:hypothetical protein
MIELLDEANHELREALQIRAPGFSRATADPLILGYYDKIQALTGKVASVPGLYNKTTLQSVIDMLEKGGAW